MFTAIGISSLLIALQITVTQQQHQQQQQYTTPVPILKQIDRQNDDGSYTYGYEAADKSFKIETKYPNGEVYGKYGYVDDQGKLREIEYGASKRGFEPAGSDINVPPPTLTNSQSVPLGPNEIDDGQYREDPSVYYKNEKFNRPITASKFSLNNFQQQQPQPQQPYYNPAPQYYNQQPIAPAPAPAPAPLSRFQQPAYQQNSYQQPAYQQPSYQRPAYQQPAHQQPAHQQPAYQQPSYQQQPYYQPQYNQQPQQQQSQFNYNSIPNHLHPAVKSLDIFSGSYSIDYTGRK